MQLRDHMHIVDRYSRPTSVCVEPFLTLWRVKQDDSSHVIYVQTSKDETFPEWVKMSDVLEGAFSDRLDDPIFMFECVAKYSLRS